MKPNDMAVKNENEIRSHRIRELLAGKPHLAIRWGSAGILLLLSVLIGLSWFVPYPEVVKGKVAIRQETNHLGKDSFGSSIEIPFQDIASVEVGQRVVVVLEGIPEELEGRVEMIGDEVISSGKTARPYYHAEIRLLEPPPASKNADRLDGEFQGHASIITEELRLFERVFGKVFGSVFR